MCILEECQWFCTYNLAAEYFSSLDISISILTRYNSFKISEQRDKSPSWEGGMGMSNRQDHVAENSYHQMEAQSRAQSTSSGGFTFPSPPPVTHFLQQASISQRFYNLPKPCQQLGTKCSYSWTWGSMIKNDVFRSNHHILFLYLRVPFIRHCASWIVALDAAFIAQQDPWETWHRKS